jgi:hypothetical protein
MKKEIITISQPYLMKRVLTYTQDAINGGTCHLIEEDDAVLCAWHTEPGEENREFEDWCKFHGASIRKREPVE